MRVFIWACESSYGGLHGIFAQEVMNVESKREANEIGFDMGKELRDTYGLYTEEEIIEACGENPSDDDVSDYLDETYAPDWIIYKIKDDVDLSITELDRLAYRKGLELFVREYCESEPIY